MIRSLLGRLAREALIRIAPHLPPPRVIWNRAGTSPYLSRWYLIGEPRTKDGSSPWDQRGNPRPGAVWPNGRFSLFLHRFHQSDADEAPHSHPWRWACSFILAGGYVEERRMGQVIVQRVVRPLSFNWIGGDDFHRVDLIEEDCWSLFLVGPKAHSWGFWERGENGSRVVPWRQYLGLVGGVS